MSKLKIGVFGAGRGRTMLGFSREYPDTELVAVIAAAIAAYEGTSTDGFVVRSIRRR